MFVNILETLCYLSAFTNCAVVNETSVFVVASKEVLLQ